MELGQRLDLAKLGLDGESDTHSPQDDQGAGRGALARLAGLLAQVGAVDDAEHVEASDTLDSLGVDSLTRIELAVRAEELFDVRVDEDTFAESSSLGDAAAYFAEHEG